MGGGVIFFFFFFFRLMKKKICYFFIIGHFIGTRQKFWCFLYAWFFILSNQIYPKGIHEKQQTLYTNKVWAKKVCKLRQNRFSKKHCKMYLTTSMHLKWSKLDGVCTVDNRPSIDKPHPFARRTTKCDNGSHDMWHVICDMWRMKCDMLLGWTFSQNFSFPALTICDFWYYEDLDEKNDWLNQSINIEAAFRTAPATPGLLKRLAIQTQI